MNEMRKENIIKKYIKKRIEKKKVECEMRCILEFIIIRILIRTHFLERSTSLEKGFSQVCILIT
jgi:hypothetical protein